MKNRLVWLILIGVFIAFIAIVGGRFLWKHRLPLPSKQKIEAVFEMEISTLEELLKQINPDELLDQTPALPNLDQVTGISSVIPSMGPIQELIGRVKEVEAEFENSEVLTAEITFKKPGSKSNIVVVYDESLNLWSLDGSVIPELGVKVSYCYSGLRQLVKYEKVVASESGRTTSFSIVFAPDLLTE